MTLLLYELLVAAFWALVLTFIIVYLFGHGRHAVSNWGAVLFFFFVVWLGTWGIGTWMAPYGPTVANVPWLLFFILAMIFAMLLAATAPHPRRARTRAEQTVISAENRVEQEVSHTIFGLYFWILVILLVAVLIVRYTANPDWRTPPVRPPGPPTIQAPY